jgi:hypothetical protein
MQMMVKFPFLRNQTVTLSGYFARKRMCFRDIEIRVTHLPNQSRSGCC